MRRQGRSELFAVLRKNCKDKKRTNYKFDHLNTANSDLPIKKTNCQKIVKKNVVVSCLFLQYVRFLTFDKFNKLI